MCLAHRGVKIHDSNPDLILDVPILAQGLPAIFLEGLPASGGLVGRTSAGLIRRFYGGLF